jgi:hypothetical protein
MSRRKGPLHYIEIAALTLLCTTIGALITLVLSYNFQTPGSSHVRLLVPYLIRVRLDGVVPTLIVTGFLSVSFCYVTIRALVRFRRQKGSYGTEQAAWGRIARRREGPLPYIEIAVRMLLVHSCWRLGYWSAYLWIRHPDAGDVRRHEASSGSWT